MLIERLCDFESYVHRHTLASRRKSRPEKMTIHVENFYKCTLNAGRNKLIQHLLRKKKLKKEEKQENGGKI